MIIDGLEVNIKEYNQGFAADIDGHLITNFYSKQYLAEIYARYIIEKVKCSMNRWYEKVKLLNENEVLIQNWISEMKSHKNVRIISAKEVYINKEKLNAMKMYNKNNILEE